MTEKGALGRAQRNLPSRMSLAVFVAILVISSVYQLLFRKIGYFPADEGLMVAVCERMLNGESLYRDIFLPVTPLAWNIEAGAFRLFGISLATARLLPIFLFSTMCGIIYLWSREVMSSTLAFWCSVAFIFYRIWVWPYWQFYTYSVLASFLAIASGYAFILFLRHLRPRVSIIACGVLAGLCFWAKPNVGIQILAAVFFALMIKSVLRNSAKESQEVPDNITFVKGCALVFGGVVAASLPFLIYLVANGTLDDMIVKISTLRQVYFESERHIAYPRPWPLFRIDPGLRENIFYMVPGTGDLCLRYVQRSFFPNLYRTPWIEVSVKLLYYFPIALLLLSLPINIKLLKTFRSSADAAVFTFTFLSSFFLFLQVFFFPVAIYLLVVFPPLIILTFAASERILKTDFLLGRRRLRRIAKICAISGLGTYFSISILGSVLLLSSDKVVVDTGRGVLLASGERTKILDTIIAYVKLTTEPGDTIFVVPHNPLIYFFTNRRNPTRYDNLQPDTPGRQAEQEIIASLEKDRTETVIFEQEEFPKKVRFPEAYPDIYRYITENYHPLVDIKGKLTIYKRKKEAAEEIKKSLSATDT